MRIVARIFFEHLVVARRARLGRLELGSAWRPAFAIAAFVAGAAAGARWGFGAAVFPIAALAVAIGAELARSRARPAR